MQAPYVLVGFVLSDDPTTGQVEHRSPGLRHIHTLPPGASTESLTHQTASNRGTVHTHRMDYGDPERARAGTT